jgi:anti-sigma regulatory factor (Ser/Thr protein kinase)
MLMPTQLTSTPATPAPFSLQNCTRFFPGRNDQIRRARALTERFLDGCPAADDAVLLVSELATNAVTHSASGRPGGTFILRVQIRDGYVRGEVEDQGSRWDGDIRAAEPPHGLFLLRELSSDCGARRGHHGWVTWFTVTAASVTT